MVNLELYRSFVAIYRVGTVSGAAEYCNLTQPAVSQQLVALEKSIGRVLFQRTPRKMVPTDDGKALYTQVAQALDVLDGVSQTFQESAIHLPLLRIGTPFEFFYEELLASLPTNQFRYRVVFDVSDSLHKKLEEGELDIIVATEQKNTRGMNYLKCKEEHFILVGCQSMVFPDQSDRKELYDWLSTQSWLSYGEELPIIRRYWMKHFKERPKMIPSMVIPNLHAILKAIEQGKGISVLPDYICQEALENNTIKILDQIDYSLSNTLSFGYKKMGNNRLLIQKFLESLLQI